MVQCANCREPLNHGQWNPNETLKSCPKCSSDNGREHVFYAYPDEFGVTDLRASREHPEGPQSYCSACRASLIPVAKATLCKDALPRSK